MNNNPSSKASKAEAPGKIVKSEAEWQAQLTPEQYKVARKHGTERAFSGAYWDQHEDGMYTCVCCGAPVFDSATKFESGTGWPSFRRPADDKAVESETDRSFFMTRTEVHCARCAAHLGHVFPDGPKPTGQCFCGAVLDSFVGGLEEAGHGQEIADLHREGFDPRMPEADEPDWNDPDKRYSDAVLAEQARIARNEAMVLVFPVWWWSLPA